MPRSLAFSAQFRPSFAAKVRCIVSLLPPYDTSDASTVGHDGAGELDQDRALSPDTRSRQLAKILVPGAFAPVVLSQQLGCDVGHRLRGELNRFHQNLVRQDFPRLLWDHGARPECL